ncbi:MFS transporter [Sphaerisporangium sp. NPDC005289]|uniref:MFS transporter n=1 Tax=Sphaerisporangium sp. NPDC005289 TaxID=3155247 RepID=UPI0033B12B22
MAQQTLEKNGMAIPYAGWFLVQANVIMITPLLVPVANHFHVGLAAVTLALTAYLLLFGVMQPFYGLLSDSAGRVRVMRLGLAGVSLGNLIAALAPNVALLITGRAVAGAFAAALAPVTVAYIGDRVPPGRRQRVMAGLMSVAAIGTATGTISAGVLNDLINWRAAIFLVAAGAAVLAALYGRLPETLAVKTSGRDALRRLGQVFRGGWFRFLTIFAFFEGAAMVGFYNFFSSALQVHGKNAAIAGIVTGSYGLGAVVGGVIVRSIDSRVTAAGLFGGGCTLLLGGFLAAAFSQTIPAILAAGLLAGMALAIAQSTIQTWMIEASPPDVRGTAAAVVASAVFTGAALSTAAVGGLAAGGQFRLLFGIAALVTLPVTIVGALARARFSRATVPA